MVKESPGSKDNRGRQGVTSSLAASPRLLASPDYHCRPAQRSGAAPSRCISGEYGESGIRRYALHRGVQRHRCRARDWFSTTKASRDAHPCSTAATSTVSAPRFPRRSRGRASRRPALRWMTCCAVRADTDSHPKLYRACRLSTIRPKCVYEPNKVANGRPRNPARLPES